MANLPPVQAWVQPPPITQPVEFPQVYVWGGRLQERRATLPRTQGQKRRQHQVDLYVNWVADDTNENLPVELFPVLVEAIMQVLRSVQLPVTLTDEITGAVSNLTDIGESMNLAYEKPVALGNPAGSLLFSSAQIKCAAHEWINPA